MRHHKKESAHENLYRVLAQLARGGKFTHLLIYRLNLVKILYYYRPQRSWAKVIFSQASVCPQGGGVSASVHAGIYPPGADPPDQTPWSRHPPGADPPEQTPPRADPPGADPPRSRPLWEQTPTPLGADTIPLGADTPPGADPWEQTPPRSRPPLGSRLQHTVNEWPVCILLECILVRIVTACK